MIRSGRLGIAVQWERATPYLWVFLGGGLGATARFALATVIAERAGTTFPLGTLLINVSGSLIIGVLLVLLTESLAADPAWRLFFVVGFLGGYTTFSSFSFEAVALLMNGAWARAAAYVVGSNGLSLLACAAGIGIARVLTTPRV